VLGKTVDSRKSLSVGLRLVTQGAGIESVLNGGYFE
jgi:hypothetical protein